jgi:hypothetical protein
LDSKAGPKVFEAFRGLFTSKRKKVSTGDAHHARRRSAVAGGVTNIYDGCERDRALKVAAVLATTGVSTENASLEALAVLL